MCKSGECVYSHVACINEDHTPDNRTGKHISNCRIHVPDFIMDVTGNPATPLIGHQRTMLFLFIFDKG